MHGQKKADLILQILILEEIFEKAGERKLYELGDRFFDAKQNLINYENRTHIHKVIERKILIYSPIKEKGITKMAITYISGPKYERALKVAKSAELVMKVFDKLLE